ncbi:MAG: glycosyltransferase family 9 protein, partial [Melioribacteraceae bacterium]|nr:glycosyltransferase family 9 protein [Melioribacteraceae bacterium]
MVQEKILVIQTAFPGDAILTLPLIEELFKKFNSPLIDVICTPLTQQIFDASEFVNKSIALDKRGKHKSLVEMTRFALKIRNSKYSKIVSPHRSFRTSYIVMLSGVKDSTGFDVSSCSFVYKFKKRYGFDYHEVQRNLSLIDEFYVEGDNWKILPKISSDEKISEKAAGEIIEKGKRGVVAIAPGSVWETKKYPQKYFSEIACNLKKENYSVVLIGGKEDFKLNEEIKSERSSNIFNLAGSLTIVESINFLRKC